MLTEAGLPTTSAQARRDYQGHLLADVLCHAEQRLGRSLGEEWLALFERRRAKAFERELKPVDGAGNAVARIMSVGIRVCVASQGKLAKTRMSLVLTGLERFFPDDACFSAESVAHGKPAPDLLLLAARTMTAEPARCVVVEDTVSGVIAASSAGMRALAYAADSDEHELCSAGAESLKSLDELPEALGLR